MGWSGQRLANVVGVGRRDGTLRTDHMHRADAEQRADDNRQRYRRRDQRREQPGIAGGDVLIEDERLAVDRLRDVDHDEVAERRIGAHGNLPSAENVLRPLGVPHAAVAGTECLAAPMTRPLPRASLRRLEPGEAWQKQEIA